MSTVSVTHYRLYCINEEKFVDIWGTTPPTKCPNDTSHSIRENSLQEFEVISSNQVRIIEEDVKTGGRHMCHCIAFDIEPNSVKEHNFSIPIPYNLIRGWFFSDADNVGDKVSVSMHPNTIIGTITQDLNVGVNTITVSETVLPQLYVGLFLKVSNGVDTHDLGRVISFTGNVVTIEKVPTINFSSGSYISMTRYFILDYEFGPSAPHIISGSRQVGAYVPANTILHFDYTNTKSTTKRLKFYIEYLY